MEMIKDLITHNRSEAVSNQYRTTNKGNEFRELKDNIKNNIHTNLLLYV